MESSLSTLAVLAEVTTGFVAFSAIVASLRVTFGQELAPFQKLLVQFFIVSGMLVVSVVLLPLVLAEFWQDEYTVARYSILYTIAVCGTYFLYYIRQRLRVKAPTPLASLFVMIGYGFWLPGLAIVGTGIYWEPTLGIIAAMGFWGLFSSVVIFVSFLAEFVQPGEPDESDT